MSIHTGIDEFFSRNLNASFSEQFTRFSFFILMLRSASIRFGSHQNDYSKNLLVLPTFNQNQSMNELKTTNAFDTLHRIWFTPNNFWHS